MYLHDIIEPYTPVRRRDRTVRSRCFALVSAHTFTSLGSVAHLRIVAAAAAVACLSLLLPQLSWGVWVTLIGFLVMIKPIREAVPLFMLQFNGLDRPEVRRM